MPEAMLTALSQSASLWGRPLELAQHWATHQPESRRATTTLSALAKMDGPIEIEQVCALLRDPEIDVQNKAIDVVIKGSTEQPYGVLEIDNDQQHDYDQHDIDFLLHHLPVLHQEHGRDGADLERGRQLLLLVHVHLGQQEAAVASRGAAPHRAAPPLAQRDREQYGQCPDRQLLEQAQIGIHRLSVSRRRGGYSLRMPWTGPLPWRRMRTRR